MAHRGRERSLGAPARPHMFRRAEGHRTHVTATHGQMVKAMRFMAMALLSLVTASASEDGAPVTAASAARARWTDAAADIGGANGAAGSPRIASGAGSAEHAAGRGDGSACTTAGDRADAGARRSRHRRGSQCKGGEPMRCPKAGAAGEGERGARRRRENRPPDRGPGQAPSSGQ